MERMNYAMRFSRATSDGDLYFGKMVLCCTAVLFWTTIYGTGCSDSADVADTVSADMADTVDSPPDGMIYIPSGTFWRGCNDVLDDQCYSDEKPQHKVTLSAYFIDTTEVTVSAYEACVSAGGCAQPAFVFSDFSDCNYGSEGKDNYPVNCVT